MVSLGLPVQAAQIVRIMDGDTIRVQERGRSFKVRFACIDAPEKTQQPYGAQAKAALAAMVPVGSEVTLRVQTTDRYKRQVAEVFRGGRNVNLAMVQQGQAFVYWQYINRCDRNAYGAAEGSARLRGVGVWSVPGGITRPWDWRHRR